jgi:hypothetical protein
MPSWPARIYDIPQAAQPRVSVTSPAPRPRRGPAVDPHRWTFGELCAPGTKWRHRQLETEQRESSVKIALHHPSPFAFAFALRA